jgi:hypothetical protein
MAGRRRGGPLRRKNERRLLMVKVKTFTSALKVFHAHEELEGLDRQVNEFLEQEGIETVVSVSDACTTDDSGAAIGIIRVVAYEGG